VKKLLKVQPKEFFDHLESDVNLDSDNNETLTDRDTAHLIPNATVDESIDIGIGHSSKRKLV